VENSGRDILTNATILRVALDTPLRRLFDYLPQRDSTRSAEPGMRVRVPFGRQHLIGVVQSLATRSDVPQEKLKAVLEVIDATPVIDAQVMELLEWAAQYYHHPLGEVIAAALPKLAREGAASRALTERWFTTGPGLAALEAGELKRAPKQRELLEALCAPTGATSDALAAEDTRGFARRR
jgi:primosomal protein N' (replication factor Y)